MKFEKEINLECDGKCGIAIKHKLLEHDWCCQICGGSHSERICPNNKFKRRKRK